jgi:hypothetical protein
MRRAVPDQPLLALRPKLPILDTSKETPHNMLLAVSCGGLRLRSRVGRGGGRERQRTVAATCGFAQVDGLVSSVMSAWAAWPR